MRVIGALTVIGAMAIAPHSVAAQEKTGFRPFHPPPNGPSVSVAPVLSGDDAAEDPAIAAKKLFDEWSARLRPLEERLRQDARLRRAGALVGLSAAAIGAVRGQQTLTFVGTQAVRIGLDRQLTAIRARSGFTVEPTLGHRSVAITVSRTFP
jgi:hypothetical protein